MLTLTPLEAATIRNVAARMQAAAAVLSGLAGLTASDVATIGPAETTPSPAGPPATVKRGRPKPGKPLASSAAATAPAAAGDGQRSNLGRIKRGRLAADIIRREPLRSDESIAAETGIGVKSIPKIRQRVTESAAASEPAPPAKAQPPPMHSPGGYVNTYKRRSQNRRSGPRPHKPIEHPAYDMLASDVSPEVDAKIQAVLAARAAEVRATWSDHHAHKANNYKIKPIILEPQEIVGLRTNDRDGC